MIGRLSAAAVAPARFAIVGGVNTAIDVALFWLLIQAGWAPAPANAVSYSAGVANSFALNRAWTFADRPHRHPAGRQFGLFAAGSLATLALTTLLVWVLAPSIGAMPAKLVAVAAGFAVNYLWSARIAFRGPAVPPGRDRKQEISSP